MKVKLDEKGYFTGSYADVGDFEGSIETDSIPDETDSLKILSYKFTNNEWTFDEQHYQSMLKEKQSKDLILLKQQMISKSKNNLSNFLKNNTVTSSCHGDKEKEYSVTAEKQQYLNTMIAVTKIGLQSSDDYRGSWNASGEESTCDWTLDELQQLAMEIEGFVRPFVLKQQQTEVMINNAETLEELKDIDISFQ